MLRALFSRRLCRTVLMSALGALTIVAEPLFAKGTEEPIQAAASVVPSIEYLEGEVTVDGNPAEWGMELATGAIVAVGEDSLCEITFDRNIVRIYADTAAVIDIGGIASRIQVNSGAVAAVLDSLKRIGEGGSFGLQTPTAVMGVRGTVFYVRVEDVDNTFVCVCNGSVRLESALGTDQQTVTAAHHSGLRFTRGSLGAIQSSIPEMAYHTDEEMEALASKIGVSIDWTAAK